MEETVPIELRDGPPGPEDYMRLRRIAGLSPKSEVAARKALPNTLYGVTVLADGAVVGMGRIIGDGGAFCHIVDIAVDPAHQGKGLGRAIMARLMDYVQSNLPPTCFVSLLADGDAHRLYSQFGFEATAPGSIGMAYRVK